MPIPRPYGRYGQGCHCEKHGEDGREISRVHCTILTKHSEKDIDNIGNLNGTLNVGR